MRPEFLFLHVLAREAFRLLLSRPGRKRQGIRQEDAWPPTQDYVPVTYTRRPYIAVENQIS